MVGTTKLDVINDAYSQLRVSGLTVNPTPSDTNLALQRLEDMAEEIEHNRNICIEYNFEANPNASSDTNVRRLFSQMLKTNLAVRLAADFGLQVPPTLMTQATQSMSGASAVSAAANIREVQYPRRMARGAGNTLRYNRWARFQRPVNLPPQRCETNKVFIGDINRFVFQFAEYLIEPEIIDTFVLTADAGLTIVSSQNSPTGILYEIQATGNSTQSASVWQQTKVVMTTTNGRIQTQIANFEVSSSPDVG